MSGFHQVSKLESEAPDNEYLQKIHHVFEGMRRDVEKECLMTRKSLTERYRRISSLLDDQYELLFRKASPQLQNRLQSAFDRQHVKKAHELELSSDRPTSPGEDIQPKQTSSSESAKSPTETPQQPEEEEKEEDGEADASDESPGICFGFSERSSDSESS